MPPSTPPLPSTHDRQLAIPNELVAALGGSLWASAPGRTYSDLRRLGRFVRVDCKSLAPDVAMQHAAAVLQGRHGEISQHDADVFWRSLCPEVPSFDQQEQVAAFLQAFRAAAVASFERARPRKTYFALVIRS